MGYSDKHNAAAGRFPDFGAIFMSNSRTKTECFKKKVFGLPSSEIKFVEKVKTGMILFLFEYEKRQLHGVFKATCDGGFNIVPKAFTSLGMQYPAQVKFTPIWFCKPISEIIFCDAIRENYFSSKKFNFGLSEKQVCSLLHLFSMRRLEQEVPRGHLTRTEDMKSEWYPTGKGGRSTGRGMLVKSIQNDQAVGDNSSPVLMHKYKGDFSQYNGEVEYMGSNVDDIVVNNQGRFAGLEVDTTTSAYVRDYMHLKDESRFPARENENYIDIHKPRRTFNTMSGHANDYLALKDESRFTDHENKDYMDMHLGPYNIDRYSKILSDKIRAYDDSRSSIGDRLMGEDLRKTNQRMGFLDNIPGSHDSNVNQSAFYRNPILEQNSLVKNLPKPTSAVIHPFQAQMLNTSCPIQEDTSSLLYNPDVPDLNFRQLSSFGIDNGSESIVERTSPLTNCRRNSSSRELCLMDADLKDLNRWHDIGGGFPNSLLYGKNRDCIPLNEAQSSDQLASESFLHEACNSIPSFKSSSASIPSSDIGNSGGLHEPFSSLFQNSKSRLANNVHHIASQENLNHGITLQKNNETYSPDIPWANEGHSQVQYDDSLDHGYDMGYYGDSQNGNCGQPKKKSSVFSRLSFPQNVKIQEKRSNSQKENYAFHTSVYEVMEMAHQSCNRWMTKRKPRPSQPNNAESVRDKTQSISLRMNVKNQEKGKNANIEKEKYDFHTSVDEVMEMAHQCHNQLMIKRKPKPGQPSKAESSRGKTQIISSRMKSVCFENALEDGSMNVAAVSGGNSNKPAEEISFVDFKRRSQVRKLSEEIERSFDKSKKSEDSLLVQQKRRKLIRPNFNNSTSDDKGVDLVAFQNSKVPLPLGSCNLKDVSENCCTSVQAELNVKTDAEIQNITGPTHFEGKNGSHAMGYIFNEEGEKANSDTLSASKDESGCVKNINCHNVLSSTADILPALNDESQRLENINHQDIGSSTFPALKDESKHVENIKHHDVLSSTCNEEVCHTKEGSRMTDNMKLVYSEMESFHSNC